MPFNVDGFRQVLQYGGQRPNLFEIEVAFPSFVTAALAVTGKLAFTAKAASVPGMTHGSVEVPYFNKIVKFPGDKTFEDWEITVINDEDFLVRNAFEEWHNAINLNDGQFGAALSPEASLNGYTTNMTIRRYAKNGAINKQYQLINAWPQVVAPIEVSWDTRDQIEEFGVTISYDYFVTDTADGGIGLGTFTNFTSFS